MKKTVFVLATLASLALLNACANTPSSTADADAANNAPAAVQQPEAASAASAADGNAFQGE